MANKVRLYLMCRQGLASPSRRLRFEPSYSGSFVPGVFDNLAVARSAADQYLSSRPDVEKVRLFDDESGTLLEEVTRPTTDQEEQEVSE